MVDIIKVIDSAADLEKKVEYYFTMPDDEKRSLLEGLKKEKSGDIGLFLNAIYPEEHNKDIQKLIRKLIFLLRSSGVKVEEPRSTGGTALKQVDETRENRGFMTNFDISQSRLVMAAYEIKKNTFVFLNGEIHFNEGLRELMSAPVHRKDLEKIIASYKADTREPMFLTEISPAYAAFIVEEGANRSGRFTDGIKPLKSFAARLKDTVHRPEDIYYLKVPDQDEHTSMEDVLNHPMFKPFFLNWEKAGEDKKEYGGESGTTIVLPGHIIEEKRSAFIANLSERSDIRSQEPFLKRMLEDYAYFFHAMGNYALYLGTIALIKNSRTFADVLAHFLRKTLEAAKDKPVENGLIINPYG